MLQALFGASDGPGRPGLPVGELVNPWPLAAVLALIINDWLLKPSSWVPGPITGKLSDVAGLIFFPLLLTATVDLVLWLVARTGAAVDFSLGRAKLVAALMATAGAFAAVKLSPAAAVLAERALSLVAPTPRIVCDASDLAALPALLAPWLIGRRHIARVPAGRIAVLERRGPRSASCRSRLNDVVWAGAAPELVSELASALDDYLVTGHAQQVIAALDRLRRVSS